MAENRIELTAEQMEQARALRALCNRTSLSMKDVLSLDKGEWYCLSRETCGIGVVEHASLSLIRDFLRGYSVQEVDWLPANPPPAAAARPPRRAAARHANDANDASESDESADDDDYPIVIETVLDSSSSDSSSGSDMDRKPQASAGQNQQQLCDESQMAESDEEEVQIQEAEEVLLPEGQMEQEEEEVRAYNQETAITVSSQSEIDVANPGMHASVPSSIAAHAQSTDDDDSSSSEESMSRKTGSKKRCASTDSRARESKKKCHSSHSSASSSQVEVLESPNKASLARSTAYSSNTKEKAPRRSKEPKKTEQDKARATESKKNSSHDSLSTASSSQLEVLVSPNKASLARSAASSTSSTKEKAPSRSKKLTTTKQDKAPPAKKTLHKKPFKKTHRKPFKMSHRQKTQEDSVKKSSGTIYQVSVGTNIAMKTSVSAAAADDDMPSSKKPAAIVEPKQPAASTSCTAKQKVYRIHSKDRKDPDNILETFTSINQAAKLSKIEPRGIQQCCAGQIPHTHDKVFVFASQYDESANVDEESNPLLPSVFGPARNDPKRKITSRKTANNSKFANNNNRKSAAPAASANSAAARAESNHRGGYSYEQFLQGRAEILKSNRCKTSRKRRNRGPSDIAVQNKLLFTAAVKDGLEGLVKGHIEDFLKGFAGGNATKLPKDCIEEPVEKAAERQAEEHVNPQVEEGAEEHAEKHTAEQVENPVEDQAEEHVKEPLNESTTTMVADTLGATHPNVPHENTAQEGPGSVHEEYEFFAEINAFAEAPGSEDNHDASASAPKNDHDEAKPIPVLSLVFCASACNKTRWEKNLLLTGAKDLPRPEEVNLIDGEGD